MYGKSLYLIEHLIISSFRLLIKLINLTGNSRIKFRSGQLFQQDSLILVVRLDKIGKRILRQHHRTGKLSVIQTDNAVEPLIVDILMSALLTSPSGYFHLLLAGSSRFVHYYPVQPALRTRIIDAGYGTRPAGTIAETVARQKHHFGKTLLRTLAKNVTRVVRIEHLIVVRTLGMIIIEIICPIKTRSKPVQCQTDSIQNGRLSASRFTYDRKQIGTP